MLKTVTNSINASQITALPASTTPLAGSEVLPIIQSGVAKQVSVANLTEGRSTSASNFVPTGSTTPTNGVYLPSANAVGISSNGGLTAIADNSNNWLVGTTTAGAGAGSGRLTVESNSAAISVPVAFSDLRTDNFSSTMAYIVRKGAVVGTISTTNLLTAYNTTSDYRLKNNQAALTNSGAFIDALQPKTWEWAQDGSKGVGFIAHEFAEVSPSSVNGEKDAVDANGNPVYQSMQASSADVIANLVAEIQSLRKRLAAAVI